MFNDIKSYIIVALSALLVVTSTGWYLTKEAQSKAELVVKTNEAIYRQAQADAKVQALQERDRIEKQNEANAKQADANYSALYAKYLDSILRYKAAQSATSVAVASAESYPPESSNGPSASTDVLTISVNDAKVCAVNTARLQAVHDWAIALDK